MTEAQERSKVRVLQNLTEGEGKARCVQVERKGLRWILTKLSGGTMELRVETGRWVGMKQEERICAQRCSAEVEDVEHFSLKCSSVDRRRERGVGEANGRVVRCDDV